MKHNHNTSTNFINKNFTKSLAFGVTGLAMLALGLSPALTGLASAEDCVRGVPQVTHLTQQEQTGDAGTALAWQVEVTNTDSAACEKSRLNISANAVPNGWTVTYDTSAVSVGPGSSTTFNIAVTSPLSAPNGPQEVQFYAVQVYLLGDAEEFGTLSPFSVTYHVQNGSTVDTQAPTVAVLSPANGSTVQRASNVQVVASASDNVGVTLVEFYADGQLVCSGTATTCDWHVPGKKGAHTLEVRAYDGAGNVSSAFSTVEAV